MKEWPAPGPGLLWIISGLGEGYSSVSIAGDQIYTSGMIEGQTYVFAFDLNGKLVWKVPNGKSWETTRPWALTYTGSRSTPTYDNGMVYHLGDMGRLAAFEHRSGKEIWSLELLDLFDADIPEYGYSESVLIDGDRLYCNPTGKKAYIICLDKKNGNLIWANSDIEGLAGFNSSVMMEFAGYRQIISLSSKSVFSVDSKNGKLLWSVEFINSHELNLTDPIIHNEYVFVSSGYGRGSMLIKLTASGDKINPSVVWDTNLMDNHHGGVILHEGYLYGSGSNSRGWFCLDFMTGKQVWKTEGKGSVTFADGMLYMLDERGTMKLAVANPEKYEQTGMFRVPEGGKSMYWAHPVVNDGRMYIRHSDKLFLYDIRDKK
jgi:outer membrane protein assembly factor BamB